MTIILPKNTSGTTTPPNIPKLVNIDDFLQVLFPGKTSKEFIDTSKPWFFPSVQRVLIDFFASIHLRVVRNG